MKRCAPRPWQGRIDDPQGGRTASRWHQNIELLTDFQQLPQRATVVTGFCCDEGVRRNHGRVGANAGPQKIRQALANLPCDENRSIYDNGDRVCEGDLENTQSELAKDIEKILQAKAFPLTLGGGHEVAWASFLGAQRYLRDADPSASLAILNLDAHFDLRAPSPLPSSGTPFWQCHEYCVQQNIPFNYTVFGINPAANTAALFDTAKTMAVGWHEDMVLDMLCNNPEKLHKVLVDAIGYADYVYLTVCLDVFSSAFAPGVSAPASVGVSPQVGIQLIRGIKHICQIKQKTLLLCDIAEMNPVYDIDGRTANLAGRLLWEIDH